MQNLISRGTSVLMPLSRWSLEFRTRAGRSASRPMMLTFFALVLVLALINFSRPAGSQSTPLATPLGRSLHRARVSPSPPPVPPCAGPTLQTIYAPTIGLPEIASGKVVFNSRVDTVTEVQLTFYTEEGLAVPGPVVRVQPAEIRYVDIASLIPPGQRWRLRWGGMSLSYTGKVFDIWAQLTLLGILNSGSSDITFSVLNGRGSDTQEAVWWMPRGGRAIVALGNSSDTSIRTQLEYSDGDSQTIDIEPHATEYVRSHTRENDNASRKGQGESVRLTTIGPAGSLKTAGLVIASDSRLISSIRFADTKGVVQQHLFATDVPLGSYTPRVVLKNTSNAAIVARPRFRPASGESGAPVELPAVTLSPEEIVELNLEPLRIAVASRADLNRVSIQILNSGAPGTLIGAIFGVDNFAGSTYDVPLRDSGINRANGGAYPWRIDGDFTTIASVTNVGDTPSRFIAEIYYQGGRYLFGHRELAVGETAFFDLKQIRNQQIPDANGAVLPANVSIGQFRWHWFPSPNAPHMIGRAAVVSASKRISASYSCMPNCGAHGPEYVIDGFTTVDVNGYQPMHTKERWCGATGACNEYNTNIYDSTVDNTSIASLSYVSNGWLNVNGLGAGETYWWWSYWYGYEYDDGFDCRYAQDEYTGSEPTQVMPRVTWTTPGGVGANGGGVPMSTGNPPQGSPIFINTTTITATGSPSGGSYSWSTSSNKVTLSNTTSATVTVTAQTESQTTGDVTITVTYTQSGVNATAQVPFTVQKPTFMDHFHNDGSGTATDCASGKSGSFKDITWQLADKNHNPIKFAIPTYDTLTNGTPNTCFVPAAGEGTAPGHTTGSGGRWSHHYNNCSTACNNGGSCSLTGTQRYFANGFQIDQSYTMSCATITVDGH